MKSNILYMAIIISILIFGIKLYLVKIDYDSYFNNYEGIRKYEISIRNNLIGKNINDYFIFDDKNFLFNIDSFSIVSVFNLTTCGKCMYSQFELILNKQFEENYNFKLTKYLIGVYDNTEKNFVNNLIKSKDIINPVELKKNEEISKFLYESYFGNSFVATPVYFKIRQHIIIDVLVSDSKSNSTLLEFYKK